MKLIHQQIIKKEILYIESESIDKNKNSIKNLEVLTILTLDDGQVFKTSIDIKENEGEDIAFISNDKNQIDSLLTLEFEKRLLEETKLFNIDLFFKFLMLILFLCPTFLPLFEKNISLIPCILFMGGMFLALIFAFKMWIKELIDFKKDIRIKKELLSSIMSFKSKQKNINAPDIQNISKLLSKNVIDVK